MSDFLSLEEVRSLLRGPVTRREWRKTIVEERNEAEAKRATLFPCLSFYDQDSKNAAHLLSHSILNVDKKNVWEIFEYLGNISIEQLSVDLKTKVWWPDYHLSRNDVALWFLAQRIHDFVPSVRKKFIGAAIKFLPKPFDPYNFTKNDFWRCVAGVYPFPLTQEEAEESLFCGMAIRIIPNPMSFNKEEMNEVRREVGLPIED